MLDRRREEVERSGRRGGDRLREMKRVVRIREG